MKTISMLWRGELPLADAFWTWAVIGGLFINGASSLAFLALITLDQVIAALIVGYLPTLPYNVLVIVGVWRSAARYDGERKWADLARIGTLAGMVVLTLT